MRATESQVRACAHWLHEVGEKRDGQATKRSPHTAAGESRGAILGGESAAGARSHGALHDGANQHSADGILASNCADSAP